MKTYVKIKLIEIILNSKSQNNSKKKKKKKKNYLIYLLPFRAIATISPIFCHTSGLLASSTTVG